MKKPDKSFMSLIMVFFLAFGLFITFTAFNDRIATFTRAKEELLPSSETSLMFAWPLSTSTKNASPVEINVFIRNASNSPVSNKKVTLTTTLGNLTQATQTTDKSGKSTFYLTSSVPGLAEISGVIDDQTQLKQKITVKFE